VLSVKDNRLAGQGQTKRNPWAEEGGLRYQKMPRGQARVEVSRVRYEGNERFNSNPIGQRLGFYFGFVSFWFVREEEGSYWKGE
jgi:hypothetical protein